MIATIGQTQPVKEQWGIFELEPGFRLWVRVMVPFVVTHPGPPKSDQLRISTVVVTEAADSFKGNASGQNIDFKTAKPAKSYEPVGVVAPCESLVQLPNNVYVHLKLNPVRARRYGDFAPDGDPLVQLDNEIQVQMIAPPGTPQPTGFAFNPPPPALPAAGGD